MIDITEIAAYLHVEEKLRGHPQYKNMLVAVRTKLDEFEAAHNPPAPEQQPETGVSELTPTDPPPPDATTETEDVNNLPGERIEDRLQGTEQTEIPRRV